MPKDISLHIDVDAVWAAGTTGEIAIAYASFRAISVTAPATAPDTACVSASDTTVAAGTLVTLLLY